jgi:hypothetical protein
VDFLYSLYDALVSINVPSDKARAVVDAMERDMGTTLATKQDLEFQTLATRKDLEILRMAMKQDLETLRAETKQSIDGLRAETKQSIDTLRAETKQDLELLKRDMNNGFALVNQRFDTVELRLTVKIGSIMVAASSLTFAALRFWT